MLDELKRLRKEVLAQEGLPSNAIDVRVEVALFQPDVDWASARANHAGTKVIYTHVDGSEDTCWADDWTSFPEATLDALDTIIAALEAKETK